MAVPANTFIATAGAVREIGAVPFFVDVDETYTMCPDALEKACDRVQLDAVIPVHLTGQPANMGAILDTASAASMVVIEDACQAVMATYEGRCVGNFGIAAAFSFHPLKNLNVWGDGGMIVTNDKHIASHLRLLRNHGLKDRNTQAHHGVNSRLDTIQAVVAHHQLPELPEVTTRRQKNALFYNKSFRDIPEVSTPASLFDTTSAVHLYMIQAQRRDELLRRLQESGIEAKVHYPTPAWRMLPTRHSKQPLCPVADEQADKSISLPVHQFLSEGQLAYVADVIEGFYAERRRAVPPILPPRVARYRAALEAISTDTACTAKSLRLIARNALKNEGEVDAPCDTE